MTAAPFHIAGERLMLDPMGALFWPALRLLAVSDLHLEKGSSFARRGMLLPPWDTHATLDRLTLLLRRWSPAVVVALGDSFHDVHGSTRLPATELNRLNAMTEAHRFIWVLGNHDPAPPVGIGGECVESYAARPMVFRHQAVAPGDFVKPNQIEANPDKADTSSADPSRASPGRAGPPAAPYAREPAGGEIVGHHHPKAQIQARAGTVSRPCFVTDARRLMMPAFGTYTGGLDVRDPAIMRLFPRGGRLFLLGRERLYSFAFGKGAGLRVG